MKNLLNKVAGGFYMFVESVKMSVANITQNRLRSFLTILGIMIGVNGGHRADYYGIGRFNLHIGFLHLHGRGHHDCGSHRQ